MQVFANFSIWAVAILTILGLGIYMAKHGEPRTGKYNFWVILPFNIWIVWTLWYFYTH